MERVVLNALVRRLPDGSAARLCVPSAILYESSSEKPIHLWNASRQLTRRLTLSSASSTNEPRMDAIVALINDYFGEGQ